MDIQLCCKIDSCIYAEFKFIKSNELGAKFLDYSFGGEFAESRISSLMIKIHNVYKLLR